MIGRLFRFLFDVPSSNGVEEDPYRHAASKLEPITEDFETALVDEEHDYFIDLDVALLGEAFQRRNAILSLFPGLELVKKEYLSEESTYGSVRSRISSSTGC